MLRCRDVAQLVASDELTESSRWRRLMLRVHLATCRRCRAYVRQIRSLGAHTREIWSRDGEDPASIRRIETAITRRIELENPRPDEPTSHPRPDRG